MSQTNGIIRSYVVSYFPTGDPTLEPNGMEVLSADTTSFTLAAGLSPFTNYTFEVLAVTVDQGPSARRTVKTSQAGEFFSSINSLHAAIL